MLAVPHLERFWSRIVARRNAIAPTAEDDLTWVQDTTMLRGLQVGLHETLAYLYDTGPSLAQFEAWILEKNGGSIESGRIASINDALAGRLAVLDDVSGEHEPVLSPEDLAFFDEHGYVVLHHAIPLENARAAVRAICEFLAIDLDSPPTWYRDQNGLDQSVPLVHHPVLWENRRSPRIRTAFEQLWKRNDLWVNVDQCKVSLPEVPGRRYAGQSLHWDVTLEPPIPFGLQGEIYLTDTAANQGAFTCVPGFHRTIDAWLANLPRNVDPRTLNLYELGAVSVPGNAGDLIIWHQALPHAGSPNRASTPRFVQYVKLLPSTWEFRSGWR